MKNKELIVFLESSGFEVDWQEKKGRINHKQREVEEKLYENIRKKPYESLFLLGFSKEIDKFTSSIQFLHGLSSLFIKKVYHDPMAEMLREKINIQLDDKEIDKIRKNAPFLIGSEHLTNEWIDEVIGNINKEYSKLISKYDGNIEEFFNSKDDTIHVAGRVYFHLVENKKGSEPFAFLATYLMNTNGNKKHLPLKNVLIEYENDKKKLLNLLSTVNRVSKKSDFIDKLVDSGDIFHPIRLSADEAYIFLSEIPLYQEAGVLCRIPNWWRKKTNSLKMSISLGDKKESKLNVDSLIEFNTNLHLGNENIDPDEIKKLLSEAEGLAFIKGKWIEVNHKKLKETLKAYEKAQNLLGSREMNVLEAMRFQLNADKILDLPKEFSNIEITNSQWIESILKKINNPDSIEKVTMGDDFNASLRKYQEKGLNWLYFMKKLGLGACLADDMGLGKTIQVIALLKHCLNFRDEKILIALPVSLIGNWMSEIEKFAPSLDYYVLHPSVNKNIPDYKILNDMNINIFITSYGMLSKYEWIRKKEWDSFILDEAQAIKNPNSKRTKIVKEIKSKHKIAMTGTPIENRLSDLWSLFDFLNSGLLGTAKEFKSFVKNNQKNYSKLKEIVNPFILRRLKTDKKIISDLPKKIEMKTYSTLSKKQIILYNKLVKDIEGKLKNAEGISRKGIVLSSIMKFKQICNHPDQYMGQENYIESHSGKFKRLREICEEIYEKRERVIIFTQFREIIPPLKEFLENIFNHKGFVLHGGTKANKRKDIIDKFQDKEYVPFIVLSIKAGGVGLNLTAANHVVHFDRWWNPSVENQATDRAFRIGQKKNVIVHKFIVKGTVEEKIDLMIEDKKKLANEIISDSQEKFITEMKNDELIDLFKLSI